MIGLANPLAPPIRIEQTGEREGTGHVRFRSAYEGPPGCVHGGFVAAAFDEVLGYVQSLGGSPGFTGTLAITYRSPTPLHVDLEIRCRIREVSGRKTYAEGALHAGDRLCAEATAIFIAARPGVFDELLASRRQRTEEREP
jgi:acyl-coenzyme A thioesterase PaaI-like protein